MTESIPRESSLGESTPSDDGAVADRIDLIRRLREKPPALDEVRRARMERSLLLATTTPSDGSCFSLDPLATDFGDSGSDAERASSPSRGARHSSGLGLWMSAAAIVTLAVGAAIWLGLSSAGTGARDPWARFSEDGVGTASESRLSAEISAETDAAGIVYAHRGDGYRVRSHLRVGERVSAGVDEGLHILMGISPEVRGEGMDDESSFARATRAAAVRLELSPETTLEVARSTFEHRELIMGRGVIEVTFHPAHRGDERLTVITEDGRVEVVGTVFEVGVSSGGTRIFVHEGRVRWVGADGHVQPLGKGESGHFARPVLEACDAVVADSEPTSAAQRRGEHTDLRPRRAPTAARSPVVRGGVGERERAGSDGSATDVEEGPAPGLPHDLRFSLAQTYFEQGRFGAARHELYAVTRDAAQGPAVRANRARAWVMIAEAFERQNDLRQAAEAYRRAAARGSRTSHGQSAFVALARLEIRRERVDAAMAAYGQYLAHAPDGPLALEAITAVCSGGYSRVLPEGMSCEGSPE